MRNLTLAIDENLLRKARLIALNRDTSVNQLVRDYLTDLVHKQDHRRVALARLKRQMANHRVRVDGGSWTREELHER